MSPKFPGISLIRDSWKSPLRVLRQPQLKDPDFAGRFKRTGKTYGINPCNSCLF
jgi:hypothetical protein